MQERLDRFSEVSEGYARFRPRYPETLYQFIFSQVQGRQRAWDVGTGNGQVAVELAQEFSEVIATDISASQLAHAFQAPNITYRICPAENSGIESTSINLITAAQAAHWFHMDFFAHEVPRVSVQGACLAIWGYTLLEITPRIDVLVRHLYSAILAGFWDPHRDLVNRHYQDFQLPFHEIRCPEFEMQHAYHAEEVLGYLRTWSAVSKYQGKYGKDPVSEIESELVAAFDGRRLRGRTPVFMRAWRI
ncbi:MAG TPA: methyltransferase domain-containing protein [Saprospiraceae bacterium]|nr:methyltransferase domain-containing protein [Saprospiraceae bacterium]